MAREKILQLCNFLSGRDPKPPYQMDENNPSYKMVAHAIEDDEVDYIILVDYVPATPKAIAERNGLPYEKVSEMLEIAAHKGVVRVTTDPTDGGPLYDRIGWYPGVSEFLILNKDVQDAELGYIFQELVNTSGDFAAYLPPGAGVFRALPVAKAIEAEPRRATYEEIKTYLDQSDLYTCADCACRTAKKLIGEPCEHTIENTCIQIGPDADHYIRTGRGKRITREEAEELLLKAEREGLVHNIFTTEGPNKSSFICNCCLCACGAMASAAHYKVPDFLRSNYAAQVDKEKCVGCGECVDICQVGALKLGETLCEKIEQPEPDRPYDTEWGPDKWDEDFMVKKKVAEIGTSPCKTECPANISIQGYIRKAAQGKYSEALELIKRDNPFPAVCGRICPHPCESECTRGNLDEALAIDDIKKFIADKDMEEANRFIPTIYEHRDEKVAVIGAGPAGLTCAYYLALKGYKVTVYEKQHQAGGMLTMGIPSFRLSRDVVSAEIDIMLEMGVEIKTGFEVGKDITIQDLRNQGYKAYYMAIGAQNGRKLGVEGEDAEGVISGVEFLRNVSQGTKQYIEGSVVVIGGGNVAIDVARTAIRSNASSVQMFCLENKEGMPALDEEVLEATEEGIKLNYCYGPKRILTDNGKVKGLELKKCVRVFDENGKFSPQYDEADTIVVEADHIIVSIGQAMDWGNILQGEDLELNANQTISVKDVSFQTSVDDIFAGGDVVTGPKYAINAVASGKEGAISIDRFVREKNLTVRRENLYKALDKQSIDFTGFERMSRQKVSGVDPNKARGTFDDLRGSLTEEQIKKETERCLGCGVTIVDQYQCIGCGLCTTRCMFDAITLKKVTDYEVLEPAAMAASGAKYAMERRERIAKKKATQDANA